MININLKINEVRNMIRLEVAGGNKGQPTSALEREFTRKFLAHINKFNTTFKKAHKVKSIKMKVVKQ